MLSGFNTPTGVVQDMLNATGFFRSTRSKGIKGLKTLCIVWIHHFIIWGSSQGTLVSKPAKVLGRRHEVGLFVAADECTFFEPTAKWCGKIHFGQGLEHNPEHMQRDMRRPESIGDLLKFLQASSLDTAASAAVCGGRSPPASVTG